MKKGNDGHGDARDAAARHGLIGRYEEIASASRSMLEAARTGDWAQVEQIELHCREMIAALKRASVGDSLSDAEKDQRIALLRSILADDAQIRLRAEPWLLELENFLVPAAHSHKRGP
jgi:flagellar protein FliT